MRADPVSGSARQRINRLRDDAIRWITRRHAQDGQAARLGRDRVYILPTRAGYTLVAILLVMLLGSINYSNNMAFLLTFLLVGIGHNAMWYTHRNLLGLRIHSLPVAPVFAGATLSIAFRLEEPSGRPREALTLSIGARASAPVAVPAEASTHVELTLPAPARGVYQLPRQRLHTRYPLGILEAWTWLTLSPEILVYPAPIDPGNVLGGPEGHATQPQAQSRNSGETPDHLRPYRPGDPPGRIVWKAFARSGKLHVRESVSGHGDHLWLDWESMPAADTETRLAMLCHQVLAAHEEGRLFGMRLPDQTVELGQGARHRDLCLRSLAQFRSEPRILDPEGSRA
ncbi:DUF58 domain-containing protein [Thioalkalivibrio sp. ALJ16]|uniref:DUF58 domain-containing protein n=1 Tax=Thioalkalivibrio sp. ALJ16 TaxID=1158762 RepID=UPI00036CC922|nr:DUF58 domain-containing protein [Thioalkalivibrio sp. ALJ16]